MQNHLKTHKLIRLNNKVSKKESISFTSCISTFSVKTKSKNSRSTFEQQINKSTQLLKHKQVLF